MRETHSPFGRPDAAQTSLKECAGWGSAAADYQACGDQAYLWLPPHHGDPRPRASGGRLSANAGISGWGIPDIMLDAVEQRFCAYPAPSVIGMLTHDRSPYIARETRVFALQVGLKP